MRFIDLEDFLKDFLAQSAPTGAANLGVCNAISYEPLDPAVFQYKRFIHCPETYPERLELSIVLSERYHAHKNMELIDY